VGEIGISVQAEIAQMTSKLNRKTDKETGKTLSFFIFFTLSWMFH
jgi:hypothetical protein